MRTPIVLWLWVVAAATLMTWLTLLALGMTL